MRHKKSKLMLGILSTTFFLFSASAAVAKGSKDGGLPAAATDADFYNNGSPSAAKVDLGKNLFFDKILSGNLNISCATCHHSLADTGDGLSLPVGEGARGLGVTRDTGSGGDAIHERVPRNAPPVFNLGAKEFAVIFHDGRVRLGPDGELLTPAGGNLPAHILDNILAAQAMFPVTSATEMAGQVGENSIADATSIGNLAGPGGVWEQLADRLQAIPGYVDMFVNVFDDISSASDITYAHAANAIAAFEAKNWRATNSPFDRYLNGDKSVMSRDARKGMELFYGDANCSSCHSGTYQTDHGFYAIAMPQLGSGKGNGPDGLDDFGRELVTGDADDRFKFRTPNLRNVALTAPYGHGGAYNTLQAIVRHHLDPVASLLSYGCENQPVMPSRADLDAIDCVVMNDISRVENIAAANQLDAVELEDKEVQQIVEFLHALTDPASIDLRGDTPKSVPSGLTLAE
jgi:cytochrome c peroxidase